MASSLNSFIVARRLLLSSPQDNSGSNQPLLSPNTAAFILIYFIFFLISLYISYHLNHLCALVFIPYPFTARRGDATTTMTTTIHYHNPYNALFGLTTTTQGLDGELLESLPKVIFRPSPLLLSPNHEEKQKQQESCAICLDEFRDEDTLLFLPSCGHFFHPQCIKAWLNTHTTCPLCRHSLTIPLPHHPSALPLPRELIPYVEPLNLQGELCRMESRWNSMDHPHLLMSRERDNIHSSPLFLSNSIWGSSDTPSSSSSSDGNDCHMKEILGCSISAKYVRRSNSDKLTMRIDEGAASFSIKKRTLTKFASEKFGYRCTIVTPDGEANQSCLL